MTISHISAEQLARAAPVLLITDSPVLVLLTFNYSLFLLASLAGIIGTLLNSRPILTDYMFLLFP